jgi:7-carboxy-7-deazaguanine synthase
MQINQQQPLAVERRADGILDVHSYFHTIQGEGPFAGRAAFFIRLRGCNLMCPWCDTEYTSQSELYTPGALAGLVLQQRDPGDIVVITGGEPFRQNLGPAVEAITDQGFTVQIETNGTLYDPSFPFDLATIVCSPKTGRINPEFARRVTAYKYVLAADSVDPSDGLPLQALDHPLGKKFERVARPPEDWDGPIFLQPMDAKDEASNAANTRACAEMVMRFPRYTLGIQMHKLTGLP